MDIRSFFKPNKINPIRPRKKIKRNIQTNNSKKLSKHRKVDSNKPDKNNTIISKFVLEQITKRYKKFSDSPILKTEWNEGNRVPYTALAEAFSMVEKISGRLKSIEIMREFYGKVLCKSPEDIIPVVYLTVNQVAPPYENVEIGVGDGLIYKVVELVTGQKRERIKKEVKRTGDLAEATEKFKSQQMLLSEPKPLTCVEVFDTLKSLAFLKGSKSRQMKIGSVKSLLTSAKDNEIRYIIRSLQGKLRIGFSESSVLASLASAVTEDQENIQKSEKILRKIYSEVPNWETVINSLLKHGFEGIGQNCSLTPGIPIKAMLAKPTKSFDEVMERFKGIEFALEYKYDGERIQIHYTREKELRFFSRNAESVTGKYPDISSFIKTYLDSKSLKSFILDCEVVAYDKKNKKILPFQRLMTRKRKEVNESEIEVDVCLFCFDCLYLNDESLLEKSFRTRRGILYDNFDEISSKFMYAQHRDAKTKIEIKEFIEKAISSNCEGLMVKSLDTNATYEPSKRSLFWLKVKKDYLESVGDSFDLVPIGGFFGKGKRVGGFGAFLVACYDNDNEEFQAVCKIGTGLTEKDLKEASNSLGATENRLETPPNYYRLPAGGEERPDVWFKPNVVWEVKCADLSLSPRYLSAVGMVDEDKGIALRFPRFVRVRNDKKPEEATNTVQISDMYKKQFK